jgi:predicted transcriptional regulator
MTMSTTTIRLPEDLKKRIAQAAENAGKSSHAFILGAIEDSVEAAERRNTFYETAERRFAEIAETGKTISWSEMRAYLLERVSGKKTPRPRPKKLAR